MQFITNMSKRYKITSDGIIDRLTGGYVCYGYKLILQFGPCLFVSSVVVHKVETLVAVISLTPTPSQAGHPQETVVQLTQCELSDWLDDKLLIHKNDMLNVDYVVELW